MKGDRDPAMVLLSKVHCQYPKIQAYCNVPLHPDATQPDTTSLIENPLEFDKKAPATLVIKNALLYRETGSVRKDIAVSGNIITQVDTPEVIEPLITKETRVLDAAGQSVLPGFTDSHLHLSVASTRLQSCELEAVKTVDEFKETLRAYAKKKSASPVLRAYGLHYFDPPVIPAESARHLLDELVQDKPLLVFAHDLHTCWANTKALEVAGLLHAMPPFPSLIEELNLTDNIVLGTDQIPSGEFREPEVYFFVSGPVAIQYPRPIEEQLADLETVCQKLTRLGITGVHRMGLAQPPQDIGFLLLVLELEQFGRLPIRVNTSCSSVADAHMLFDVQQGYLVREALAKARRNEMTAAELHDCLVGLLHESGVARHRSIEELSHQPGIHEKLPNLNKAKSHSEHLNRIIYKHFVAPHKERNNPYHSTGSTAPVRNNHKVRCDTIKIFMDGVIEKDTAYRLDQKPEKGIPEFKQEEVNSLVEFADRLGMQVAAHSIGNGSVRSMLDAISNARTQNKAIDEKRGHRIPHRIEHIEMCKAEDVARFGPAHIVASMQPLHERPPVSMWHQLVPEENWNTAFAWKELMEDGALVVFGSDWPIVSCDVRTGIHHAVSRKPWVKGGKNQALNLAETLQAYTANAAQTEYSQKIKGAIQPGMLADIVILSGDIESLQEEAQPDMDVCFTICDGQIVYEQTQE